MTMFADSERARFDRHVLRGPGPTSCWIWVGAIGDDGYGRFWIRDETAPNGQRAVRPHRWALAALDHSWSTIDGLQSLHLCDVPLCVRATTGPDTHLIAGTRSENMRQRSQRGRLPAPSLPRYKAQSRQHSAARIRELRDALTRDGWDDAVIQEIAHGTDPNALTLL